MRSRYRVKITPSGYILVGLTLAVALAGVNTGNNLLYLSASGLLALMTVSGLLSWLNLGRIRMALEPPEEIFAGLSAPFRLHLSGPRWPCFFLRLRTPYGETAVPYFRKSLTSILWLRFPRRGRQTLLSLELASGYPLGFFRRTRLVEVDLSVTVYPHPLPGPLEVSSLAPQSGLSRSSPAGSGEPEDFLGLKPYRKGVPASRIAWKASARARTLQIKEFGGPSGQEILIDLTPLVSEEVLSRATHLVLSALKEGMAVGLKLPELEIPPGRAPSHRRRLLEALAHA